MLATTAKPTTAKPTTAKPTTAKRPAIKLPSVKLPTVRLPAIKLPAARRPTGVPGRGPSGRGGPHAPGRFLAWWAAPLLAVLTAVAVLLGLATYRLVDRAVIFSQQAARRTGGPLVIPAPRSAGGYPRRLGVVNDPALLAIDTAFRLGFGAVGGKLVYQAGRTAGVPAQGSTAVGSNLTTSWTSALYGEPGRLDPTTFRPGWILYRGLDTTGLLGHPSVTIIRLMRGLLGADAVMSPWPVAVGHRGGSASCAAGWLGQKWVSVCGWATDHTIGALVSPARDTSVRALAVAMVKMRYDLQRA